MWVKEIARFIKFWSKKTSYPKTFWVKSKVNKYFGSKSLSPTNLLGSTKKMLVKIKFLVQKPVDPKIQIKVGSKHMLDPSPPNLYPKLFYNETNLGSKNIGSKLIITLYPFIMDHPVSFTCLGWSNESISNILSKSEQNLLR